LRGNCTRHRLLSWTRIRAEERSSLEPGQKLVHYQLVEKIGEGGMGVVWRAADTRLDRDVAIKILPDLFARDADRLARFEREAKLLAALNHPNIAAIYGVEHVGEVRFLVLELVSGEPLDATLARGALPMVEALEVAEQVAAGLQTAHEQGILHRDLKPANIRRTPAGRVKILDFGLAKALLTQGPSGDPAMSPTITHAGTIAGSVLGTASYMSPEQARGRTLDRRTDVWSFGCVVYEILTGRRAFPGETVSDVIARVIQSDPDWTALPQALPETLRRLLIRCLQKDPERRLRDIGDLRLEIRDALAALESGRGSAVVSAVTAALHGAVLAYSRRDPNTTFDIMTIATDGKGAPKPLVATAAQEGGARFSPDGRYVAYVSDESGRFEVYVIEYPGPGGKWEVSRNGGRDPIWSADGSRLYFRTGDRLMTVPIVTRPSFSIGNAEVVIEEDYEGLLGTLDRPNYDVAPDGRVLLLRIPGNSLKLTQVRLVQNFFRDLDRDAGARPASRP
jgi:hypothetical protein